VENLFQNELTVVMEDILNIPAHITATKQQSLP